MSENVGLSTPRGSGTSGYVQRNLSHLKPRDNGAPYPKDRDEYKFRQRQPNKEIIEHEERLKLENEVLKYRDELEEKLETGDDARRDLTEDVIEEKVDAYRKKLESDRVNSKSSKTTAKGLKSHQVHELGQAKIQEMENMRKALKIRDDYEEGGHWKEKEERLRERGDREEEQRSKNGR
ncbi:hypothetical protein EJ05DRAFT_540289 [Pseudovirgaria hyperparasitica]|uniref:CWF21 domain-containing protein n=1 Tax=Pseudovirgaria hyperparasitica TaxID=470096 RepID=A0A6A6VY89_9PEZI|nr:uncharacterized protein EJ05DRAFT_540289 [Pseudovirgaria hyperparasitica]KAF2755592.1 hypothetical protein EJ05DRAFT_540289 [Pseudovirgaria hyperparasitica]